MSKTCFLSGVYRNRNRNWINNDNFCCFAESLPVTPEIPPSSVFRPPAECMGGNASEGDACYGTE